MRPQAFRRRSISPPALWLALIVLGALTGLGFSLNRQRWYEAWFEVATSPDPKSTLPDPAKLRRLALDPETISLLSPDDAPLGLRDHVAQSFVMNHAMDQSEQVWRIAVAIPASSADKARERIRRYVDALAEKVADAKTARRTANSLLYVAAEDGRRDDARSHDAEQASLVERLGRLEEEARAKGIVLAGLADVILSRNTLQKRRRDELASLAERIVEQEALLTDLRVDGVATGRLEKAFPTLRRLDAERASALAARARMIAQLTPEHPKRKALDRTIAALDDERIKLIQRSTKMLEEELAKLARRRAAIGKEIEASDRDLAPYLDLHARKRALDDEWERWLARSAARTPAPTVVVPPATVIAPGPATPNPLPAPTTPRSARRPFLVAGPIVGSDPIEPHTARNTAIGAGVGLLVAISMAVASLPRRRPEEARIDLPVMGIVPHLPLPAVGPLGGEARPS